MGSGNATGCFASHPLESLAFPWVFVWLNGLSIGMHRAAVLGL